VKRIKTGDLMRDAIRPKYSVIDNMMLRCTVGNRMRDWENALKSFIEYWKKMERKENGEI
jgi:dTDP-4-dehydrorhamnose reductase